MENFRLPKPKRLSYHILLVWKKDRQKQFAHILNKSFKSRHFLPLLLMRLLLESFDIKNVSMDRLFGKFSFSFQVRVETGMESDISHETFPQGILLLKSLLIE